MTRIIAIASQKGGVGKTTTAVNLASLLHHAGRRTLLVDVDPQGNATSGVGAERSDALLELIDGRKSWGQAMVPTKLSRLFVLPSFRKPEDAGAVETIPPDSIRRIHDALLEEVPPFDFAIIDCPPSFGPMPELALQLADSVLIPVQSEYYAMEGLSQILPLIEEVGKRRDRPLEIEGLLLTMFSEELELSYEVLDEVRRYFPDTTLDTVIPRDVTLAEASSHGLPICEYNVRSRGAWAYVSLGKEILCR